MGRFRGHLRVAILIPQVGLTIAVAASISVYLGYQLDQWFQSKVLFSLLFGFLGVIAGIRAGYQMLIRGIEKYGSDQKRNTE